MRSQAWRLALCWLFIMPVVFADEGRPNILWLVAEDMSPWIACYGDETVATPNLDRLAREGVRYTNAFATSPVCAPARSSIITGMYATRIGTMQMRTGNPSSAALERDPEAYADIPNYEGLPPAFVRCFPERLRRAGYYCTNASKTDYQFKAPVTVWDDSSGKAHWRNRAPGQPFFAVFNFGGTHESQAFPKAKRRPAVARPEDLRIPPFYPDTPAVRDALLRTYNNIASLDGWIGQRLEELEAAGLAENTVVFFYGDHGVGLPRGKRSVYDTGTRVPLLIRHPGGAKAGSTDGRVVSFVDLAPTVLSLAGIEADERLDGTAFAGSFLREGRGLAFAHADRFDAVRELTRSVSDGRYRYVRNLRRDVPYLLPNAYRDRLPMTADLYALRDDPEAAPATWQMRATERPAEEFYDCWSDPWEVNNLAGLPEHELRMTQLRAALDEWIADTDDLGLVLPETRLVKERIWPPLGVQPKTAAPRVESAEVAGDAQLEVTCETPGASIGLRWIEEEQKPSGSWQIYTGPIAIPTDATGVQVEAHRIGFLPTRTKMSFSER